LALTLGTRIGVYDVTASIGGGGMGQVYRGDGHDASGRQAKPIRIWMHASENDLGANREESTLRNWVLANQHMAAALRMHGYTYRYVFAEGAGHVDDAVFNQTLPSALEWLWEGYRPR
jgi:iron(III)-enterobactin esterase